MAAAIASSRLRKEYRDLSTKPLENIQACPLESNLLEWHYVIEGTKGTAYEGGWYHGTVIFPPAYPMKPPSIQMFTPNGRFKIKTRLCLSMSDFHPESWNPMWSVGTILMGLYSFMLEESPTYGSISTSLNFKKKAAKESLSYNCENKVFVQLFPDLVELNNKIKSGEEEACNKNSKIQDIPSSSSSISSESVSVTDNIYKKGLAAVSPSVLIVIALFIPVLAGLYMLIPTW